MNSNFKLVVFSGLAIMASFTSCQKDMSSSENFKYANVLDVTTDGTSTVVSENLQSAFVETGGLIDSELAVLVKMKEEEKLARDVYSALYTKWGNSMYSRISEAENNHLYAIIRLLKYYGSTDTLVEEAGTFEDINVQNLYNELLSAGLASIEEGFKTGALIEEMDIKDLKDALTVNSNENVMMVFENLERGSRNHLRAFYNQLSGLGIAYVPTYLSQDEFTQIVTSPIEKGKLYKMKANGKGKGNGNCNNNGQGKRKGRN
jgi:hypothetical protein